MPDKPITLIISDLHVGGGPADPGDDHIYQNAQLVRFLRAQAATSEGQVGKLELFFNGDFLEFAQTNQGAFAHTSDEYWCTEAESMAKLESILQGHPNIFAELAAFQRNGNLVTIAAGNHDVDLFWPKVQQRLREAAGVSIRFELGSEWVERHGGRLQIGHGHMSDVANRFKHWDNPIRGIDWGIQRLEMCPGTLFMVKFVNKLEGKYPFADNLLPVTKLATVLLRDDKSGFASVGWMFSALSLTTSLSVLGSNASDDHGARLLARVRSEEGLVDRIAAALAQHGLTDNHPNLRSKQITAQALAALMFDLLGRMDNAAWQSLFDVPRNIATLGSDEFTLSALARANFDDGKENLRNVAQQRIDATGAKVVVMGHTHQPDQKRLDGGMYYNPGCWTRYLELQAGQKVTLEDLKDESRYPYQLNVVRVEAGEGGAVKSEMVCFERG